MFRGIFGLSLSDDSFSAHWHVCRSSGFCSDKGGFFLSGIGKMPEKMCNPFLIATKDALMEEEIKNGKRSFGEVIP